MRIIVCGSRGCASERDFANLARELSRQRNQWAWPFDEFEIIHGACPDSADELSDQYVEGFVPGAWKVTRHPSKPGDYLARNSRMVESGADLVVALWDGKSRGTLDTIRKAIQKGIPVKIIPCVGGT